MKCPECVKQGLKSCVYENGASTTLVNYTPYYDEDGEYHDHDGNITTHNFHCSQGHYWSEKSKNQCPNPNCDWGKEKTSYRAVWGESPTIDDMDMSDVVDSKEQK